ncbi:hypothetical protein LOK49_LG09G02640 [Camellia lanceoleosa]|uniref:Uncharacterized protein n=1 Tax=Camellia lanceoleosa TaxID=1840588 RepID=A0ACC0GG09_9ERIC|nr:hypothetical protein LOK49_LG09G02640 [Camellia lanceoleosa]
MEPFRSIAITFVPHVSFLPFSLSQPPILLQPCTPSAGYHTVAAATTITSQHLHAFVETYAGIVAPGVVVESIVVPIDEHVSPILVPKPNVVVESMVVPTVEHETNTLLPKPNIVVALENIEENRILLTPSILKLDGHLHEQTKQAKNKMKVRLNNNRRKKIPKLQLIDESSSSTGPYGGPCTQHSDARVDIQSPFTTIAGKKRKANQKVPTKTKLHLDESDSSLDTKEDKFDQSLNLFGKLLGLNFEASATAIESSTTQIVRPCPLSAEEQIVKAYCFDLENSEDIVVMELFYTPVEFATRFDLCSLQPKTWICGSQHIMNGADHAKLCDEYFGESRYTEKLHACQQFDKLERFRLLVDLVNDSSNRISIEVMNRLEQYKERYSRLQKARRKKKV